MSQSSRFSALSRRGGLGIRLRDAVVTIVGMSNSRLVYSTDGGDRRRQTTEPQPRQRPIHADGAVRVSREKGGRRGKTVTIVSGLPPDTRESVAGELKRHCGAGGSVKEGVVEIQGDHRDKVAARLRASGYDVKVIGG
jgi:translation initiation factor 1